MGRSLTATRWISRSWCNGTRCTARQNKDLWRSMWLREIRNPGLATTARPGAPQFVVLRLSTLALRRENNDEPRYQIAEPGADERTHEDSAARDAGAARRGTRPQLHGGQSRLQRGAGADGSPTLPRVCQADLHR